MAAPLRMILVLAVLGFPLEALAATDDELMRDYDTQDMACRQFEDADGTISAEAADLACQRREDIVDELKGRGLCYDYGDRQWSACGGKD